MTEEQMNITARTLTHLVGYCKELMTEHIAMDFTLRHHVGWHADYESHIRDATISADAAFDELERAIHSKSNIPHALDHFCASHPLKR
jgi:hypothetical protein